MPTTHYAFRALPFAGQYATVIQEGRFLMTRYEEEDAINLYHMPGGFFAETYYNQLSNEVYRCETFVRGDKLDDYALYVQLPPLE